MLWIICTNSNNYFIFLIHAGALNHLQEYSVCQNSAKTCIVLNIQFRNHEHLRTLIQFQTTRLHLNFAFKNCFKIFLFNCIILKDQVYWEVLLCHLISSLLCLKDCNACFFRVGSHRRLLDCQDEETTNLENVRSYSTKNKVSHPRGLQSSAVLLWEPQM
jgi:hypothetical protein